jgi:hypothetical protein
VTRKGSSGPRHANPVTPKSFRGPPGRKRTASCQAGLLGKGLRNGSRPARKSPLTVKQFNALAKTGGQAGSTFIPIPPARGMWHAEGMTEGEGTRPKMVLTSPSVTAAPRTPRRGRSFSKFECRSALRHAQQRVMALGTPGILLSQKQSGSSAGISNRPGVTEWRGSVPPRLGGGSAPARLIVARPSPMCAPSSEFPGP